MATAKYSYKMGNDNGNANHDVIINGDYVTQANVYTPLFDLKGYNNVSTKEALHNIMDKIVASIISPALPGTSGTYLIGNGAFSSGSTPVEFHVGFDKKSTSEIPIINTLGLVSAYTAKKHYEKTKKEPVNGDVLNVEIQMTTALPIDEYYESEENREVFINRFLKGPHNVVLHLGNVNVTVNVKFTQVYVTPEAASVYWALNEIDQDEKNVAILFEKFLDDYKDEVESITAKEIANSRILHVDIGSGTTEYPLTAPAPNPAFITGKDYGIGHAIDKILSEFGKQVNVPDLTRLEFDKIIKGEVNAHLLPIAKNAIEPFLREQAMKIYQELRTQIRKARHGFDYILVYGGGSILLEDHLKELIIEELKKNQNAKLLYVPKELAVKLNALGLNAFVNHEVFQVKTQHQIAEDAETTNA